MKCCIRCRYNFKMEEINFSQDYVYEVQLHKLFDSCVTGHNGLLNRDDLLQLCDKLQLGNKSDVLVQKLMPNSKNGSIDFSEFKDLLISVLSQQPEEIYGRSPERAASPRIMFGEKKYGRRSRPVVLEPQSDEEEEEPLSISCDEKELKLTEEAHLITCQRSSSMDEMEDSLSNTSTCESGIFSFLDPENTGYADSGEITSCWESVGVRDANSLLSELGFESRGKIRLVDLTTAMEELTQSVEGCTVDHRHIQAVLGTYQSQLRYLRLTLDHIIRERDKLRNDVAEANQRATIMAQDIDESHARLETTCRDKIRELEKKFCEQLREREDALTQEKEKRNCQQSRFQLQLEESAAQLKEEESLLREQLERQELEIARLEQDNRELLERVHSYDKTIKILENEVVEVEELRERLSELESGKEVMAEQRMRALMAQLQDLDGKNKQLQDRNDELSLQVENLRSSRKRMKNMKAVQGCSKAKKRRVAPRKIVHRRNKSSGRRNKSRCVMKESESSSAPCTSLKRRGNAYCYSSTEENSDVEVSPRLVKFPKRGTAFHESLDLGNLFSSSILNDPDFDDTPSEERKAPDGCDSSSVSTFRLSFRKDDSLPSESEMSCLLRGDVEEVEKLRENTVQLEARLLTNNALLKAALKEEGEVVISASGEMDSIEHPFSELKRVKDDLNTALQDIRSHNEEVAQLARKCEQAEKEKLNLEQCLHDTNDLNENLKQTCQYIMVILNKYTGEESDSVDRLKDVVESTLKNLEEGKKKVEEEKKALEERSISLEEDLVALKGEYDSAEEYWLNRVREEREIYDQQEKILKDHCDRQQQEFDAKIREYEVLMAVEAKLPTICEPDAEQEIEELQLEIKYLKGQLEKEEQKAAELQKTNLELHTQMAVSGSKECTGSASTNRMDCSSPFNTPQMSPSRRRLMSRSDDLKSRSAEDLNTLFEQGEEGRRTCVVDVAFLEELKSKVTQQEEKVNQLQDTLTYQSRQTQMLLKEMGTQHQEEMVSMERMLSVTKHLLQDQMLQYNQQVGRLSQSEMVRKELSAENGHLLCALQHLEQRRVSADGGHQLAL